MPRVSVIMSVFNREEFVEEAIDSILNQTFSDFEFLIVDDGSTDTSREKLTKYNDPRVQIFLNDVNRGNALNLNDLILKSKGEYLAIMDSDDASIASRLEIQVAYMDDHLEVGISGGARIVRVGDEERIYNDLECENVNHLLPEGNVLAQPTVIMRKSLIEKFHLMYDPTCKWAEDYDLWLRSSLYFPIANIKEPVLYYRHHPGQIGQRKSRLQERDARRALYRYHRQNYIRNKSSKNLKSVIKHLFRYISYAATT